MLIFTNVLFLVIVSPGFSSSVLFSFCESVCCCFEALVLARFFRNERIGGHPTTGAGAVLFCELGGVGKNGFFSADCCKSKTLLQHSCEDSFTMAAGKFCDGENFCKKVTGFDHGDQSSSSPPGGASFSSSFEQYPWLCLCSCSILLTRDSLFLEIKSSKFEQPSISLDI
jgi:hypothetical protein